MPAYIRYPLVPVWGFAVLSVLGQLLYRVSPYAPGEWWAFPALAGGSLALLFAFWAGIFWLIEIT